MASSTILSMKSRLESLEETFNSSTFSFKTTISRHEGRFTDQDQREFDELLQQIKRDAREKIEVFFSTRFEAREGIYSQQIQQFQSTASSIDNQLAQFRKRLEQETIELKKEQARKEQLMEHFSIRFSQNLLRKQCMRSLKQYAEERRYSRKLDNQMDSIYKRNLLKKAFFPWRTLTYKDGFASTVRRQTEQDIKKIHSQYQSIVDILKNKILQTDEIIRVKKAAKGQFAFALNKNLLKTISNLSLEVMSLNQMALRDGEWDTDETKKFMGQVDGVIQEKIGQVRQYKKSLRAADDELSEGDPHAPEKKQQKKITFI